MEFNTPFYQYHPNWLEESITQAANGSRRNRIQIRYALKANHNPLVLSHIQKAGFGIDAVSGPEVAHALDHGFSPDQINLAGAGKTRSEIRFALEKNIHYLNVESLQEIHRIQEIASELYTTARICLRVNPDIDAQTHPHISTGQKGHKFGIEESDLKRAFQLIKASSRVHWLGYHFHVGSQILNIKVFEDLCHVVNQIQQKYTALGWTPSILNLGGGLGIDYHVPHAQADFQSYFNIINKNLIRQGAEVHVEPGRSLVAGACSLVSEVQYTKLSGGKNIAILDAGMNHLMRPALYGAYHHIEKLGRQNLEILPFDIHGPICESSDCFGRDRDLPKLEPGDLLEIHHAGAYGETMASAYNLRAGIPLKTVDRVVVA